MKVELFSSSDIAKCQNQVNQFLYDCEQKKLQITDVKFSAVPIDGGDETLYSAMVIIANASVAPAQSREVLG
jgi:hypothetical protein